MSETTLIRDTNVRFGFSYLYPKGWIRFESENSDGVRFVATDNDKVAIYAFGQYAVATHSVNELVSFVISDESQKSGFQLLSDEPVELIVGGAGKAAGSASGRRLVYRRINDCDLTRIQEFLQIENIQYSIGCEAPSYEYPAYESLFSEILQGWQISGLAV